MSASSDIQKVLNVFGLNVDIFQKCLNNSIEKSVMGENNILENKKK